MTDEPKPLTQSEYERWREAWLQQLREARMNRKPNLRVVRDECSWREDPHFVGDWTIDPSGGFQL